MYTSVLDSVKIVKQLDQDPLQIYCDKGVSRILVDIYLQRKDEFQIFIRMFSRFHAAKYVAYWINKHI